MKKASFNLSKCDACGDCLEICDALSLYTPGFVDQDVCDGCNECVEICDRNAFTLVSQTLSNVP